MSPIFTVQPVDLPVRSFDAASQRTRKVHHACGIQAKENGKCD